WPTWPWTRTCTSRRSRRWPATSVPAAARAGRPGGNSSGRTCGGRASPTAPARGGGKAAGPGAQGGHVGHPPRMVFFTDTSVCIGCKACEVACKEWNEVPEDGISLSGLSYDNTVGLGASTWRHVAFIEQPDPASDSIRWLMSSDVCKHCTEAAC